MTFNLDNQGYIVFFDNNLNFTFLFKKYWV